jgi:hypothetical protein
MMLKWLIDKEDALRISSFIKENSDKYFVRRRIERNLEEKPQDYSKDIFWCALANCLLTTQQKSGPKSAITRFLNIKPFPLDLSICEKQSDMSKYIVKTLSDFGGIRRSNTISKELAENLDWLNDSGWKIIEELSDRLLSCRKRPPIISDKNIERSVADETQKYLKGIGPKQSRNLWQMLGYTRYEIPVDSRITKWLNKNGFPITLSASALGDQNYYDFIMDGIQEICAAADVLPCVFDAVIFSLFDKDEWPEDMLFG